MNSLEGKESDGVAPVISTDTKKNPDVGSDFKGPTECRWDDECASEQNQVITFYKKRDQIQNLGGQQDPVTLCEQEVCLRPRQVCLELVLVPKMSKTDCFCNLLIWHA